MENTHHTKISFNYDSGTCSGCGAKCDEMVGAKHILQECECFADVRQQFQADAKNININSSASTPLITVDNLFMPAADNSGRTNIEKFIQVWISINNKDAADMEVDDADSVDLNIF